METSQIIRNILGSRKYRSIHPPTVERVVKEMAVKYPNKEVEKQARKKLHQLVTTYFTRPNYAKLTKEVKEQISNKHSSETICTDLLKLQSSTRERLPIYPEFYARIFEITGRPSTIADYGCGVNPFSYPWIGEKVTYTGYDLDCELNQFISEVMNLLGLNDVVTVKDHDVFIDQPEKTDIALFLKILPLLENQSLSILQQVPSSSIVVSFPTKTISGREVGMRQHHTERFSSMIEGENWNVHEIEYNNELVFIIKK